MGNHFFWKCISEEINISVPELNIPIGIAYRNVLHYNEEDPVSLEDWFANVSDSAVFDYIDKTPPLKEIKIYEKLSQKYNLPLLCGGWFYVLGRDEKLLFEILGDHPNEIY